MLFRSDKQRCTVSKIRDTTKLVREQIQRSTKLIIVLHMLIMILFNYSLDMLNLETSISLNLLSYALSCVSDRTHYSAVLV